jgi:hypothetical protein
VQRIPSSGLPNKEFVLGWRWGWCLLSSEHASLEVGMVVFIAETGELTVPEWVIDIDAYRRWVDDADFPEEGRIWWLRGKVWADMSREQIFTHLAIKNAACLDCSCLMDCC